MAGTVRETGEVRDVAFRAVAETAVIPAAARGEVRAAVKAVAVVRARAERNGLQLRWEETQAAP